MLLQRDNVMFYYKLKCHLDSVEQLY